MIYDNRDRTPLPGYPLGAHFGFTARGQRLLYCYIRKNACSAFKRMIVTRSPERAQFKSASSRLQFMRRHHGVCDIRAEEFDHTIFVYRDPVDRAVSVFRNKFIQRDGNKGIFANYAAVTGRPPEKASFSEFLEVYLGQPLTDLDMHLHPQAAALASIRYSDAIPLRYLHGHMTGIVGRKAADRFFLHSTNSSAAPAQDAQQDARGLGANLLHARWQETGAMPPAAAFLQPSDAERLRAIYAVDCRMLAALQPADPPAADPVPTTTCD